MATPIRGSDYTPPDSYTPADVREAAARLGKGRGSSAFADALYHACELALKSPDVPDGVRGVLEDLRDGVDNE